MDAYIVDSLNIVEIYKFEEVQLYVENMMDHAVLVHEPLFLEAREPYVGEGVVG